MISAEICRLNRSRESCFGSSSNSSPTNEKNQEVTSLSVPQTLGKNLCHIATVHRSYHVMKQPLIAILSYIKLCCLVNKILYPVAYC